MKPIYYVEYHACLAKFDGFYVYNESSNAKIYRFIKRPIMPIFNQMWVIVWIF